MKEAAPQKKLSRRAFFRLSMTAFAGAGLTACAPPLLRVNSSGSADGLQGAPPLPETRPLLLPEWDLQQLLTPSAQEIAFITENANIPASLEALTKYQTALTLLYHYFETVGPPTHKAKVGWIDTSRMNPYHPAFSAALNLEQSRNFAHLPPTEGAGAVATDVSQHANLALQFATELGSGGTAGFCQPDWSQVCFATLYDEGISPTPDSLLRCAAAIHYLVDSGVGVIGIIPTWWESQVDVNSQLAFEEAIQYALSHNVFLVVAGGNMNADLGAATQKRALHERIAVKNYPHFFSLGGVDEQGEHATWVKKSHELGNQIVEGSNYGVDPSGKPYMSFVSQATNRVVPALGAEGFMTWNGTTFTTGEFTAALAAVQAITGRDAAGNLPSASTVAHFFTETALPTTDPGLSQFGLPQYDRAFAAAIQWTQNHFNY